MSSFLSLSNLDPVDSIIQIHPPIPTAILNFLTALSLQTLWIWKNPHISLLQWNCWALLEKITQWYGWLAPQISLGKVQQSFDLILISFLSHSPQTVILSLYLSLYCFPTSPFLWVLPTSGKKIQTIKQNLYHLLGPTSLSNPSVHQPSLFLSSCLSEEVTFNFYKTYLMLWIPACTKTSLY